MRLMLLIRESVNISDLPKLQYSVKDSGSRLHHNTTRNEK